jgi:hypothetical protein
VISSVERYGVVHAVVGQVLSSDNHQVCRESVQIRFHPKLVFYLLAVLIDLDDPTPGIHNSLDVVGHDPVILERGWPLVGSVFVGTPGLPRRLTCLFCSLFSFGLSKRFFLTLFHVHVDMPLHRHCRRWVIAIVVEPSVNGAFGGGFFCHG